MRTSLVLSVFCVVGCFRQEDSANKANGQQGGARGQSAVVQDLQGVNYSLLRKDAEGALGILREALVNKNDNLAEIIMPFIPLVDGYHFRILLGKEFSDVIPLLKKTATGPLVEEDAQIMAAYLLGKLSGVSGVVEWEKGEIRQFLNRAPDHAKARFIGAYQHPRKEEILEIFQYFSENPLPEEPWDCTVVVFISNHVLFDTSEKYPLSVEEALWWAREITANEASFSYHCSASIFFPRALLRGQTMQAGHPRKWEAGTHEGVAAQEMPHEDKSEGTANE